MAITVSNATIDSGREYEIYQRRIRDAPKLYRFTYMIGGEQMKTSILAPDEKSACILFDLLAAENGGDIRVENVTAGTEPCQNHRFWAYQLAV